MADARALFDGLIEHVGSQAVYLGHLRRDSDIVHSKDFESGVVKLQSGLESELSVAERNAVKIFLREDAPSLPETAVVSNDFSDTFLASKRRRVETSRYRFTLHVSATSNICERLLSNARLIMTHLRASMDPASCDMLLFLKFNFRF